MPDKLISNVISCDVEALRGAIYHIFLGDALSEYWLDWGTLAGLKLAAVSPSTLIIFLFEWALTIRLRWTGNRGGVP